MVLSALPLRAATESAASLFFRAESESSALRKELSDSWLVTDAHGLPATTDGIS